VAVSFGKATGGVVTSGLEKALRERLAEVESRLEAACRRAGRTRQNVMLLAVTKSITAEVAALLPALGVRHLGESRPQELWKKASHIASVHWHLIGHLQRNKIEQTLPLVHMIHSVDSVRLLQALEQEAGRQQRKVPVLLEVNVGREPQKHGFATEDVVDLPAQVRGFQHVHLRGLMTMAPMDADLECCRSVFAELRHLRDRWRHEFPAPHELQHLSMGMSNDFEVAVEEGATIVRLGSVLFSEIVGESA
jgi:pyridoxal phosphate enzyme (YggS family)